MQELCKISIFSKKTGSSRQLQYYVYKKPGKKWKFPLAASASQRFVHLKPNMPKGSNHNQGPQRLNEGLFKLRRLCV